MSHNIGLPGGRPSRLPSALEKKEEIFSRLRHGAPALFLDYDGTLTPIVTDPARAVLPPDTKKIIAELAGQMPVAVLSGRALTDVKAMVGLDGIFYSGSHGFSIEGPGKSFEEQRDGELLQAVESALPELEGAVSDLPGVRVEPKPLALAVHYRQADDSIVPELERRVAGIVARHPGLRKTDGKKVFEVRPDTDWDKGKTLLHLVERIGSERGPVIPLYIGDDKTDEDAFRALQNTGVGILVSDRDCPSAACYRLNDTREVAAFLQALAVFVNG